MKYTILGANGFVGSALVDYLKIEDAKLIIPDRSDSAWLDNLLVQDLGIVFYCIGLTADFRQKPHETIEAHICLLNKILQQARIEQLVYLSSTRIYECMRATEESLSIHSNPNDPGHLYNLSKLMGESICLHGRSKATVVRLSNVYGPGMNSDSFLSSVLSEASRNGKVELRTSPASSKDYISIDDVVNFLCQIALGGKHRIYNLGSGINTSNADIAEILAKSNIKVEYMDGAHDWSMPAINVSRLNSDFGRTKHNLLDDLPKLIKEFAN